MSVKSEGVAAWFDPSKHEVIFGGEGDDPWATNYKELYDADYVKGLKAELALAKETAAITKELLNVTDVGVSSEVTVIIAKLRQLIQ